MMRHIKNHSYRACRALALLSALVSGPVWASEVLWDNDLNNLNYSQGGNWAGNFLPAVALDEAAIINNGDAVFLNTSLSGGFENPARLNVDNGFLEIQNGGSLTVLQGGASEAPDIAVGGLGSLTVRSGGSLTSTDPASRALLAGSTRIVGPTATFSAAFIGMGNDHTLIAEITNATTHSPISTIGDAELGGTLRLEFNGVTPSIGNSWTIIDAATISQGFDDIATPTLPLGQTAVITTPLGGNGLLLTATIAHQLVLSVNVPTGATSIDNVSTTIAPAIDGYSITAPSAALDPVGWTSFEDNSQAGWEEANEAQNHLGELNLTDSRTISTSSSIDLGTAFVPPTLFGDAPEELTFTYHEANGVTRLGAVNFVGANNLVLQVDPSDGQTQLINPSGFDVSIDGYSVTSASGALDIVAWTSFQDDSQSGWEEANEASNHVGELNLTGSRGITKLEGNSPIAMGALFDFDKVGAEQDLVFTFHLAGGVTTGDFDEDGDVDGADFLAWQRGDSPNGGNPSDLMDWEVNYGSTGGGPGGTFTGIVEYVSLPGPLSGIAAVPEPSSGLLALLCFLGLVRLRTQKLTAG